MFTKVPGKTCLVALLAWGMALPAGAETLRVSNVVEIAAMAKQAQAGDAVEGLRRCARADALA